VQAHLRGKPVPLAGVASSASRYNIFPSVLATSALRRNVVNAVGPAATILTQVIIAGEHATSADAAFALVADVHVVSQTYHSGNSEGKHFRANHLTVKFDDVGLALIGEQSRSLPRNYAQGLVSYIQHKCPAHKF